MNKKTTIILLICLIVIVALLAVITVVGAKQNYEELTKGTEISVPVGHTATIRSTTTAKTAAATESHPNLVTNGYFLDLLKNADGT